jgi:hypothetical protein
MCQRIGDAAQQRDVENGGLQIVDELAELLPWIRASFSGVRTTPIP